MTTQRPPVKPAGAALLAVVVLVVAYLVLGHGSSPGPSPAPSASQTASTDSQLAHLFQTQAMNVQVQGQGTVDRVLADDNVGARHQRFILRLASGQTLEVAHNIDIAPRLNGLVAGDSVGFYGEYVYTAQGGTIHWTHHDPEGKHVTGWLQWNGQRYS